MTAPQDPYDPYEQQRRQQRPYPQQPYQEQQGPPPGWYQPQPGYQPGPGRGHGGPPRRRRHTGRNIFLSLAIVVLIIIIAAVASSGSGSSKAAATSTGGTAAAPTSAPPAAPVKPHVIAVFHGDGIQNTPQFTTPASWVLRYSFDCAAFGQSGNFAVTESGLGSVAVNRLALRGHGVTRGYSDAGRHYLEVNSECRWTMRVVS